MADKDNKRGGIAGKVATPKTASPSTPQALGDTQDVLAKAIGARIKVTTIAPHSQTYDGLIYTACPIMNALAIDTRSPAGSNAASRPGDYHVIPISKIQNFQIIAPSSANGSESNVAKAVPAIGPLDTKRLKQREEQRISKLKEQEQDKGKGVTKEAQAIFDAFKKINQTIRWHNQEMIVHDSVIISPPYRVEDCKSAKDKQGVLNRVKQILEGERKKLKDREGQQNSTAPRKGG